MSARGGTRISAAFVVVSLIWWLLPVAPAVALIGFGNTGYAIGTVWTIEGGFAISVPEDRQSADLNGDGDRADSVVHVVLPGEDVVNTGRTAPSFVTGLASGRLVIVRPEAADANDHNGDGDQSDTVFEVWDPTSGSTLVPLALGGGYLTSMPTPLLDGAVAFWVSEAGNGTGDLNGDGDTTDSVLHLWSSTSGVSNLHLAGDPSATLTVALPGAGVAFTVNEGRQGGTVLNADGDTTDSVLFVLRDGVSTNTGIVPGQGPNAATPGGELLLPALESGGATDLNGDGDSVDYVLVLWSPAETRSLGIATGGAWTRGAAGVVSFGISESAQGGVDRNGDGDALDFVAAMWDPSDPSSFVESDLAVSHDLPLANGWIVALASEWSQGGTDLNGNGRRYDSVPAAWNPADGTVRYLPVSSQFYSPTVVGDVVAFRLSESANATDYNGDGDQADEVEYGWQPDIDQVDNSGVAISGGMPLAGPDGSMVVPISEATDGRDHTGDGDLTDLTAVAWRFGNRVADLGVTLQVPLNAWSSGALVGFAVGELAGDRNGDGDTNDTVFILYGDLPNATMPDTTPPVVSGVTLDPQYVRPFGSFTITATVDDTATGGSTIAGATAIYGVSRLAMAAVDGAFDEATEDVRATFSSAAYAPGQYQVCVAGRDAAGVSSTSQCATQTVAIAPTVSEITFAPNPAGTGQQVTVTATAADFPVDGEDIIGGCVSSSSWLALFMDAADGAFDETTEVLTRRFAAPSTPGAYTIRVDGIDESRYWGGTTAILTVVDDDPPTVTALTIDSPAVPLGATFTVSVSLADNDGTWSHVAGANVSMPSLGVTQAMSSVDGAFDGDTETATVSLAAPSIAGTYDVCVVGSDNNENWSPSDCASIVVYEPVGSVTASGWVPSDDGRVNFAVKAKFDKAHALSGDLRVVAAGHVYRVSTYGWMAIDGSGVWLGGEATRDGASGYQLEAWIWDTPTNGGTVAFTVRDATGTILMIPPVSATSAAVTIKQ